MAGHSKWAQIKHRKTLTDAKKSKLFSKISALISVAARKGTDPASNVALREAILRAREINMPQENIERAIKRGAGSFPGQAIEEITFEAYGPGGVALLVHAITDNRNRAVNEIRAILKDCDGKLAETGSVRWLFEEVGCFTIAPGVWNEALELWFIDQGASDVKKGEGAVIVYAPKEKFEHIRAELVKMHISFASRLEFMPKSAMAVRNAATKEKLENLFDALDENDSVEEIYSNAELL